MKFIMTVLLLASHVSAQHWYKGEAIAVGGDEVPIVTLRLQALNRARVAALEQVGIAIKANATRLQNETGDTFIDMYGSFAESNARGMIVEERNVQSTNGLREERGQTLVEVKVSLDARIEVPAGSPDLTFELQMKTDKTSYYEGDDLQLTVTSTKDGYLSLFQIKNDSCFILYPHPSIPTSQGNFVPAYTARSIPPPDKPYSFELNLEGGNGKSAIEYIVAVVTKDDYPIGGKFNRKEFFSLQEYNEWLIKIPVDRRSSASSMISIMQK